MVFPKLTQSCMKDKKEKKLVAQAFNISTHRQRQANLWIYEFEASWPTLWNPTSKQTKRHLKNVLRKKRLKQFVQSGMVAHKTKLHLISVHLNVSIKADLYNCFGENVDCYSFSAFIYKHPRGRNSGILDLLLF